jgi:hypothetical protein
MKLSSSANQGIPRIFKKPEGSLQCLKYLATGPYPKPEESNPHILILFLYWQEGVDWISLAQESERNRII